MRGKATLLVLALGCVCPGCALIQDGIYNVCTEIRDGVDDARERARNRHWAAESWAQLCASAPQGYSKEFAQGYKDGFAEYLYSGKTAPPPVAPPRFRSFTYQTPAGYQAIEDWFAGYRQGVTAAVESGYRRWVTAPVAVPLPQPPPPVPPIPPPAPPVMEVLPPPRPTDPEPKPQQEPTAPPQEQKMPQQVVLPPQEIDAPPQEVVQPPPKSTAPAPVIGPPKELTMPPATDSTVPTTADWHIPPAHFGIPRTTDAPARPRILGTLLPPGVAPPEPEDFEEQEPPTLGLPQPRTPE